MQTRSRNAHKCDGEPELAIAEGQNSERKCKVKVELRVGAYLTVHWYRDIHPDNAKYYADKTKDAREGINLSSE